jgi:hypothetical protein
VRSIAISTDVFARLWSLRKTGEDTEDAILRRILWAPSDVAPSSTAQTQSGGVFDARHNVLFPEGFEVFRSYLGRDYSARAMGGRWVLGDGRWCASLNELSRAIGAKTENAWQNWFFSDQMGGRRPVSEMRDPTTISARKRDVPEKTETPKAFVTVSSENSDESVRDATWRDDVRTALERLGGQAPLHRIYREVELIRKPAGRSVPSSLEATIRRTLEDHSSDSENFRGADLFSMPEGKGAGIWALRR